MIKPMAKKQPTDLDLGKGPGKSKVEIEMTESEAALIEYITENHPDLKNDGETIEYLTMICIEEAKQTAEIEGKDLIEVLIDQIFGSSTEVDR